MIWALLVTAVLVLAAWWGTATGLYEETDSAPVPPAPQASCVRVLDDEAA